MDVSIKNQVATSISHIYSFDKPVVKTLHRAINITIAKAELFAIQCSINQAIANHNVKNIIFITDFLHIARRIFDSSTHLYQIHSASISIELREFFSKDSQNCIKFWDCPNKQHWALYQLVDKETKNMVSILLFLCKQSWNFCKKSKCESIMSQWKIIFQVSNFRGRNFLDLLSDNLIPIELSCSKDSPWLLQFGYSNLLCYGEFCLPLWTLLHRNKMTHSSWI